MQTANKGMGQDLDKIIDSYRTDNPFKVPDNYFVRLNNEVMTRLPEKTVGQKSKTVSMWDKVKPLLYLAAMLAGLYFCIQLLIDNGEFGEQAEQQTFAGALNTESHWANVHITEEEFFRFIEEQLTDHRTNEFLLHQFFLN